MNVFDLFAKLSLDTSEYDQGLDDAESKGESFGSKLSKGLGTAGKVAGGAMLAVGTASVALGKSFVDNAKEVATYGDNIDKMSQKMGFSAEAFQEWDFIMQHNGSSIESVKGALLKLDKALESDTDAWDKLGLSQEEMLNMSSEDRFEATIKALQNVSDETEKAALAQDVFGKSYMEMMPLLNQTAEETENMKNQVHELGGVMSDEAVKASAQYTDSLTNMQTAMTGLKNNMMSEFLPAVSQVMDGLSKIFSGDMTGLDDIDIGIDELITNLTKNLPKIMEVGVRIIESLGKAIITNLPKILPTVISLITGIGQMLIDNLPLLLETGLELLTTLITTLAEDLPDILITLVDTVVNMIPTLIDALVGALPEIINGMITLVLGIVDALPTIIQSLIDALPTIISAIIDGLLTALPQLIQGAITLVIELVKHLPEIIMGLIQAIPEIISAIIEGFAPLVESLGELASKAIDAIVDWFKELPHKIGYWFGEMVATATKFISELPSKIKEKLTNVVNAVKEWGPQLAISARDAVIRLQDKFMETIRSLPDKVKQIGRNIVEGLKNGIAEKWEDIKNWFSNLGQGLIDGFKAKFGIASPSKVFAQMGGYMAEGLQVGWDDEIDAVKKDIENLSLDMNVQANTDTISTNNADSELADLLRAILNRMPSGIDANSIFKLVRTQNEEFKATTGASAFV